MKLREILREAWRNVLQGNARSMWLLVGVSLISLPLAIADGLTVTSIVNQAQAFRDSGSSSFIITAKGQISGHACATLSEMPGVLASGALRNANNNFSATNLPNQSVEYFEATPGIGTMLGLPTRELYGAQTALVLEDQLATKIGVEDNEAFNTTQGLALVSGTYRYPDDGRVQVLSNAAVLLQESNGWYDQCWAKFWQIDENTRSILSRVAYAQATTVDISTTQLNPSNGARFDGATVFDSRPSKYAAIACFVLCFLFGLIVMRQRRLEFATAKHMKVTRVQLVLQTLIEAALWGLPFGMFCTAALWTVNLSTMTSLETAFALEMSVVGSGILGTTSAAVLVAICAREKTLFTLVKER